MKAATIPIFLCTAGWTATAAATNAVPAAAENRTASAKIVVEASRLDASTAEVPQFVEMITRRQIDYSGARDALDALERNSEVQIRHLGGNNPALMQISMRGYGENSAGRVLVAADGETLNHPDMGAPDFSRIPLFAIDRIEVLHGPQTVMHGGNASAGMVNFVTENPDYRLRRTVEFRGGSWNTVGGTAGISGGDEEELVSYRAGGSWDHSDGYRDRSGYDLWRGGGSVRKEFADGSHLRISAFYSDSQYELPGALTFAEWKQNPQAADTDYRRYGYRQSACAFNLSGTVVADDENEFKFAAAFSRRHERYFAHQTAAGYVQDSPFDTYSFAFTPQYVNTSRIAGFDQEFTLGGTARRDVRLGYNRYDYTAYTWKQKEDQTRWTVGAFARDEFFLAEEFSAFAGVRLERMATHSESLPHPSRNDNLVAYEAGVNWRPLDESKIFLKWARFYRAPFVDETAFTSGNIVSPERGWSTDAGGEWQITEEFSANGSLYLSETRNEIYYDPFRFDNFNLPGRVRRYGTDLRLAWEREKTAGISLRCGFVDAQTVDGDYKHRRTPAVPRHQVALTGRFHLWREFFVRGSFRHIGEQYSISDFKNNLGRMKGYPLFAVGCQYECESGLLEGFEASVDIDNLFDKEYCDYATYGANFYPGAGRCLIFRIRYRF